MPVHAARPALIGAFEGLVRDPMLAAMIDYPAAYDEDDIRRAFGVLLEALVHGTGRDEPGLRRHPLVAGPLLSSATTGEGSRRRAPREAPDLA